MSFRLQRAVGEGTLDLPVLGISIRRCVREGSTRGRHETPRQSRIAQPTNARLPEISPSTRCGCGRAPSGTCRHDGLVSPLTSLPVPSKTSVLVTIPYLFRASSWQVETTRHFLRNVRFATGLWLGFKNIVIPIPKKSEQDLIVTFLDRKTAEIDALIAKKQRQIELLDEQKAILINRAVTRGLNPNAKLKPSGVEWIGEIPEHWEIKSAKHACECIIDCKNRTPEVVPGGAFYVLRTSNVKKGRLVVDEITRTDFKHYTIWTERGAPKNNDVLFTREAPAGEACLFDGSIPGCLGQRMMYFRTDQTQLLPQFLVHTIYQGPSATYILLKTNGSTVGHLRLPQVYALPILLPPVAEQKAILAKIQATEEAERTLIQTVNAQIQSLKILRSTIIAHAVTGQLKVSLKPKPKAL